MLSKRLRAGRRLTSAAGVALWIASASLLLGTGCAGRLIAPECPLPSNEAVEAVDELPLD